MPTARNAEAFPAAVWTAPVLMAARKTTTVPP